jgi:Luciferase-like monooxygenase
MRIGIAFSYAGGFREAADQVVEFEKIGVTTALVAEAYSYDAISQLGYLAAKTSTIELSTGIVPIYTRTPALLAMTAAGLDYVSDGRSDSASARRDPRSWKVSTVWLSTPRWGVPERSSTSAARCGGANA